MFYIGIFLQDNYQCFYRCVELVTQQQRLRLKIYKEMKKININHLRAIKNFRNKDINFKISDYEKFLVTYVSMPTARKIIKELIEYKIVSVIRSKEDLRVKHLEINETDIEKYL